MEKFLEVKEATRNALRSSSVDARQTPRVSHSFSFEREINPLSLVRYRLAYSIRQY